MDNRAMTRLGGPHGFWRPLRTSHLSWNSYGLRL